MFFKKFIIVLLTFSTASCTMVAEKRNEKVDKETKFLSPFLNNPDKDLISKFGQPTKTIKEANQEIYIYEIKGRIFDCQRKFVVDNKKVVSGFESTCWD